MVCKGEWSPRTDFAARPSVGHRKRVEASVPIRYIHLYTFIYIGDRKHTLPTHAGEGGHPRKVVDDRAHSRREDDADDDSGIKARYQSDRDRRR